MVSVKLAVVIDKSQSYLDFQKDRIIDSVWNYQGNVDNVESFSNVGEVSLFGDASLAVMQLKDINAVKDFVALAEKLDAENKFDGKISSGLIILTPVLRVSTKKLEAFVAKKNGLVVLAKENSKDKENIASKLVAPLSIPRSVKDYVADYAGDDYDNVLSLVNALSSLSTEAQKRVTIEDVYIRMPQSSGSIPPWDVDKNLFNRDIDGTITAFRRFIQNSHYLVVLSVLKNKILAAYRASVILQMYPRASTADIASKLGVPNNYSLTLAVGLVKTHGPKNIKAILNTILKTESKVKGGSAADSVATMEMMLVLVAKILNNKPQ